MKAIYAQTRQLIAEETARLLHEEGYRDYLTAKTKATQRLSANNDKQSQPTNLEIHQALLARFALFASDEEQENLNNLRTIALEAMEFLDRFKPSLVSSVLYGTAGLHSPITLHLLPEVAEDVIIFLGDQQIPFQTHERKHIIKDRVHYLPLLRFYVDNKELELVLFDQQYSTAPRCHIFGKPMMRANKMAVEKLNH